MWCNYDVDPSNIPGWTTTTTNSSFGISTGEKKREPVRALYQVYLANKVTGEIAASFQLATSEADAITLAILEKGVTKDTLTDWVKSADEIMNVPEVDEE